MLRIGFRKAKALILAVVLLNGGGGMPLLDVALFHRHAGANLARSSVEAGDVERHHGEVCRLGWTLPYSTSHESVETGLAVVAVPFSRPAASQVKPPASAEPRALPQSRAPPSSLA